MHHKEINMDVQKKKGLERDVRIIIIQLFNIMEYHGGYGRRKKNTMRRIEYTTERTGFGRWNDQTTDDVQRSPLYVHK